MDYMRHYGNNDMICSLYVESKTDRMFSFFIVTLCLVLLSLLIFLSLGKIDIVITSNCIIRTGENISAIKNAVSGFVTEKAVVHGSHVNRDDVLFSIDSTYLLLEKTNAALTLEVSTGKLHELTVYEQVITSEINTIERVYQHTYTRAQRYFLEREKLQLVIQKATDKVNQEKSKHPSARIPALIKEYEIDLQLAINALYTFRSSELVQIANEKLDLNAEIQSRSTQIKILDEQIKKCEIRAPISGIYEELIRFNEYDYLFSGDETARIIPDTGALKVELLIESRNIAEIKPEMPFYIRFESLSSFEFGQVSGKIANVGADIITTAYTIEPVFTAYGILDTVQVESKEGYTIHLRPGMAGECRILVKTRTIIGYILEKIGFLL
jgi:multidrug resistance efflux pump